MKKILLTLALSIALVFPAISQSKVNPNKPYKTLSSDPGYFTLNELCVGIGLGDTGPDYSTRFFGLTTIEGYQFNQNIQAGLGTGAFFYNGGTLIPLFMDFRFKFNLKPITPYLFEQTGALLLFSDFQSSKIFVNVGAGGQYAFSKKLAANFGLGGMIQAQDSRDVFLTLRGGVTYIF